MGRTIKISPAMIAAGVSAFLDYDPRFEGPAEVVASIYEAMALAQDAEPAPAPKTARLSRDEFASAARRKATSSKGARKA